MKRLVITGGKPLHGDVYISGSKNAAVGIIPATILANDVVTLENVPDVSDVRLYFDVITSMGGSCRREGDLVIIDTRNITSFIADQDAVGKMRGSSYLMGALLGRFGKAEVILPGGCSIGPRPIDQHLKGFNALGCETGTNFGRVVCDAGEGLHGGNIYLDTVSVGATINIMLAACMASGNTVIEHCAMEPHVVDVANFLNMCGANIRGAGTNIIKIKGVERLHGCTYSVIPDQIEAGTFMVAVAATHGEATVRNIIPRHEEAITAKLEEMNVGVEEGPDWVRIYDKGPLKPTRVKTEPYPGFPTDMQPQITALLSLAEGESQIQETIWNSRFSYVAELNRMGADIRLADKLATVNGTNMLRGTTLRCPDLRAGAAFVCAALAAEGTSKIYDIKYIDRGYESIEEKLKALGADIIREDAEDEEI